MQNNSSYYNKRAIEAMNIKVQGLENQIRNLQSKLNKAPKLIQPVKAHFDFSVTEDGGKDYIFIYYEDGKEKNTKITDNITYGRFGLNEPTNLQVTPADLDIQNGYILRADNYIICDIKGSNIYYAMTKSDAGQKQDDETTPLYNKGDILRFNTKTKTITKVQNPALIFGDGFASMVIDYENNNEFYVYFTDNHGIKHPIYITNEIVTGMNPTIGSNDIRCLRINKIGDAEFGIMFEQAFVP